MADGSIKCHFMLKNLLQSNEPQAIGLDNVQDFPDQVRKQWYEAIVAHNISTPSEGRHNFQSVILDPDGGVEVKYDPADSDTATLSADYVTLSAALAVLEGNEQTTMLNPAEAIEVLHQIRLSGEHIPQQSIVAFNAFILAAKIHQSSKSSLFVLLSNPQR